jgi:tetratricopeptide (TPR) repeat protein
MSGTPTELRSLYEPIMRALKEGEYVQAEKLAIQFLQITKIVPQGWVFLGEALLRQGFKHAAKCVFQRALLLDPLGSWEQSVIAALDKLEDDEPRTDIEALLKVKKVTVSAAMIVKNEERCICRCIDSIVDAVDEIIVLDTGSTDSTLQLLQQYPQVKIFHYVWKHDFADARNEALKHVTSDWVCWFDADHRLHPEDVNVIREAAGALDTIESPAAYIVGEIESIHSHEIPDYNASRFFAMRHRLRYWGKIHEQVGGQDGMLTTRLFGKPIRIRYYHDGYDPTIVHDKKKLERNIILLKEMIQEEPDNPAWWAFYGRETLATGDVDLALDILLEAEQKTTGAAWYGRILDIHLLLLKIYISKNDLEQVEGVCMRMLDKQPDFPDALYWLGRIKLFKARQHLHKAQQHLTNAKVGFDTYRGTVTADHQIWQFKADRELEELAARMSIRE